MSRERGSLLSEVVVVNQSHNFIDTQTTSYLHRKLLIYETDDDCCAKCQNAKDEIHPAK